jgi:hypothetical protein
LKALVTADAIVGKYLSGSDIDGLFDPSNSTGECDRLIDAILKLWTQRH